MKAEELCEFVYDVDYYVKRFIKDEVADHGIDPPEGQINIIRENVSVFLDDCVRVGWYLYLNFYNNPEKLKESCFPRVCRFWSYQMYMKTRDIGIYLSPDFPFTHIFIGKKEDSDSQNFHCCEVIQNLDHLPSPEIIEECHLVRDTEGIKCWHGGCENYRMAHNYTIAEYPLDYVKEKIKDREAKKHIIKRDIPFLQSWVTQLGLNDE